MKIIALYIFLAIIVLFSACEKYTEIMEAPTLEEAYDNVNSFDCVDGSCETTVRGPFATLKECEQYCGENQQTFTDPRDGKVYKTIEINGKKWFKENLRFTEGLTRGTESSDFDLVSEPVYTYYENDEDNLKRYGVIYNGYCVTETNLCPDGWHVSTAEEFEEALLTFDDEGKAFISTAGWNIPHDADLQGIRNKSGFTALPGGQLSPFLSPFFTNLGERALFWTSSETGNTLRRIRISSNGSISFDNSMMTQGFYCRCIED